ncbi:MAG: discoidin domain-containing protein, partial [Gemmatimonadales bacterium]
MIALVPALRLMMLLQAGTVIDDFESVAAWKAIPSDDVTLKIGQDGGIRGKAMRLDFDFHGHGGYAVAHRDVKLALSKNHEFTFSIRADAPLNTLEFKLIDPSGENVWWSNQPNFVFPKEWRTVTRKKRQITFAWGPIGGGEMKNVAGIEIAITAGTGGKGTVWIDDLKLTPLDPEGAYNLKPKMSLAGPPSNRHVEIDFLKRREFGGLVLDWDKSTRPASYTVSTSIDGRTFTPVYTLSRSTSTRDYLHLPESDARYIRFTLPPGSRFRATAPFIAGLKNIDVKPLTWSATMNDFLTAVAHDARLGSYPRYFSGKQSYWTVIGVSGDTREALIDEQGSLETGKAQFSLEPFLFANGKLNTWNDAVRSTGSVGDGLPIPTATWRTPTLEMTLTGFASGEPDSSVLYAQYRIRNLTAVAQRATLYVAMRPFQVNPPWQFLNTPGGFAPIDSISFVNGRVRINADRMVIPLTPPTRFGAMSFDEGNIVDMLRQSKMPSSVRARDQLGRASGALSWDVRLAAKGDTTIDVAVPLHTSASSCLTAPPAERCDHDWTSNSLATVEMIWREKLNRVAITLPPSAAHFSSSIRANLADILINRDGPAIQPGSRSYERSWIRDGSLTSTALLRLGQFDEVREFINWYARFQFANGKIPCCVDTRGADPVPENDSNGEFIYVVAEYYRHTGDKQQLEKLWPSVSRAFGFMDSLRLSRTTAEYRDGDKRVFFGLMPQSISHEGYSAKPMHS